MPLLYCPTKKELIPLPEPLLSQLFKLNKIRRIRMSTTYWTGESPQVGDIIKHDYFEGIGFVYKSKNKICAYFPSREFKEYNESSPGIEKLIYDSIGGGEGIWVLTSTAKDGNIAVNAADADLLARNGKLTAAGRKFIGLDDPEPKPDLTGGHTITIDGVEYAATLTKKE